MAIDLASNTEVVRDEIAWLEGRLGELEDWRALGQLEAREARGEGLNAVDGQRLKALLLQSLSDNPLFERYNVDVVLEHHDHTFKRTHPLVNGLKDKFGVVYLGDGSWGKLRVPKQPESRPYLAAVSPAYHVTLHRLEGDQRFHVALEESGRVADVCATFSKRPAKR